MKFFEAAVLYASDDSVIGGDHRPDELVKLRDATHPTCAYYRYLDVLVCRFRPLDVIEIGTYVGTSAAHLANSNYVRIDLNGVWKNLYGQVTTVDINPDAKRCVDALGYPNIRAITGNSLDLVSFFQAEQAKVDLLYIDGLHNFSQAYREYFHYRQFVREGGLIVMDDVGLPMDGDEMNILWDAIREPKHRVDHLHPNVGFGLIEKRADVGVLNPETAIDHFASVIQVNRKGKAFTR